MLRSCNLFGDLKIKVQQFQRTFFNNCFGGSWEFCGRSLSSHTDTLELCGVTKNHPFCFMKQEINFTLITKQQEDKTHIFHHTHTHTHTYMHDYFTKRKWTLKAVIIDREICCHILYLSTVA